MKNERNETHERVFINHGFCIKACEQMTAQNMKYVHKISRNNYT